MMPDFSLQEAPRRVAVAGELLVTYRFRTGSIGLASPLEMAAKGVRCKIGSRRSWWSAWKFRMDRLRRPGVAAAVRVSPGTRLRVNSVPSEIRKEFGIDAVEHVNCVQLGAEAGCDRDAIRFRNGRHVLLQRFGEGVWFEVLADGSHDQTPDEDPEIPCKLLQPAMDSHAGAYLR
jgi:hypothetical protein